MAEITVRRSGELLKGVFKILVDDEEGMPAKEVMKRMEGIIPPTDFEASDYPNRPAGFGLGSSAWHGIPRLLGRPARARWWNRLRPVYYLAPQE